MEYRSVQVHPNSAINSTCQLGATNFILTGGGNDDLVRLCDTENLDTNPIVFPKEHIGSVNGLSSTIGGNKFISGGGSLVVLWDVVKGQTELKFKSVHGSVRDEIFDCQLLEDNLIVTCGSSHQINFFDTRDTRRTRPIYSVKAGTDTLKSLDYNGGDKLLAVAGLDGCLHTLDFRRGELVTDPLSSSGLLGVKIYENGTILVTGEDGTVRLKSQDNLQDLLQLRLSHSPLTYRIESAVIDDYHNNNKYLVSGSEQGQIFIKSFDPRLLQEIRLWSLKAKTNTTTILLEANVLSTVKFFKQFNLLVGSSGNGFLHVWQNVI